MNDTLPCQVCGERPGTISVVSATPGGGRERGLVCQTCARELMPGRRPAQPQPQQEQPQSSALDEYGRNLTDDALAGRIDPVIGRDAEIEQAIEILARRRKNNAVLIGEAGVGKTAIAEGLALRIADDEVPETLRGCKLVAL